MKIGKSILDLDPIQYEPSFTSIYPEDGQEVFTSYDAQQLPKGELLELKFEEGWRRIDFNTLSAILSRVSLPSSLDVINEEAFDNQVFLKEVILREGIKEIPKKSFRSCTYLYDINLPKSINVIASEAFMGSGIKKIIIPEKVKYIGTKAFALCNHLEYIEIRSTGPCCVAPGAFIGCKNLKEVRLSDVYIDFGMASFAGCISLKTIAGPGIYHYDDTCFAGCGENLF